MSKSLRKIKALIDLVHLSLSPPLKIIYNGLLGACVLTIPFTVTALPQMPIFSDCLGSLFCIWEKGALVEELPPSD